jgi:hypothetical protein
MVRSLLRRRATKLVLLLAGLSAGWVASAGADIPPLPTIPTLPQVPTLPVVPPAPQPPQAPPAPAIPEVPPVPPVSRPAAPLGIDGNRGAGTGSSGGSNRTAGSGSGGSARHAGSRSERVYRLHFSRNWIARSGSERQRRTTLVFTLRRASLVELVVVEVAPACRRIGRVRMAGHQGVNRVRIQRRVGRHTLGPGTYRIQARTLPGGRTLARAELVVVRRPARDEIASARGANTCAAAHGSSSGAVPPTLGTARAAAGPGGHEPARAAQSKREERGVLGARFTRQAVEAVRSIPPWLYAIVGLAIVLLGVASLPLSAVPTRRGAAALAENRAVIALGGAGILVAAMVAFALH